MYETLDMFRISSALAKHAGAQQATVATNVANVDTPGYRAQTLPPFVDSYGRAGQPSEMRTTRTGHLAPAAPSVSARAVAEGTERSPNGNSVSIEDEMLRAVDAQREHSRALAIYRHAMGIIRTSLGR